MRCGVVRDFVVMRMGLITEGAAAVVHALRQNSLSKRGGRAITKAKIISFSLLWLWVSAAIAGVVDQSYDITQNLSPSGCIVAGCGVGNISLNYPYIQTFTAGLSGKLESVDLFVGNYPGSQPLTVSIYSAAAYNPDTGLALLGSTSIPSSMIPHNYPGSWLSVDLSAGNISLQAGSRYAIKLDCSDSSSSIAVWFKEFASFSGGDFWTRTGSYWSLVNGVHAAIGFKTLMASIPPVITQQPQSQSVVVGNSAAFGVAAQGAPPITFQWRFNGTNIGGATNFNFTIIVAQPANQGQYDVVMSNPGGSVTSAVATLTILSPPSITNPPQSQVVVAGTNALFSVGAIGTPPLSFQWQFYGTNIFLATNAELVVANSQAINSGDYAVVVTNYYGAVTSSIATLTVRYSLAINISGGGTVARVPNQTTFPPDFAVILTATPSSGYAFNFWSGDATGNANPLNLTMTTNKAVTANFASTAITVAIQGEGTVSKSPDKSMYDAGEQVSLNATPGR